MPPHDTFEEWPESGDQNADRQPPSEEHAALSASLFRMLADSTRVKILWILLYEECSVLALADRVAAAPPAVSQHLAKLRLAGLVTHRREGTFMHYRATSDHVRRLLTEALSHAEHIEGKAADNSPHRYRA